MQRKDVTGLQAAVREVFEWYRPLLLEGFSSERGEELIRELERDLDELARRNKQRTEADHA